MTTPPEDATLVDKILSAIGLTDATRLLSGLFRGHSHRVMSATVGGINTATGLGVSIPDYVARSIVAQGGTHMVGMDIAGQTRRSLFSALAESRVQGLHPSSAATRRLIQEHVSAGRFVHAGTKYRAKLIARTETMHAQNQSALAAYDASSAVQAGQLADNQMGYGDADCAARDGHW